MNVSKYALSVTLSGSEAMTPDSVQARPLVQREDSSTQIPEALRRYLSETHISVPQAVTPILCVLLGQSFPVAGARKYKLIPEALEQLV